VGTPVEPSGPSAGATGETTGSGEGATNSPQSDVDTEIDPQLLILLGSYFIGIALSCIFIFGTHEGRQFLSELLDMTVMGYGLEDDRSA
jgi:hypothetical protein